ncbi:hypothetical protein CsSME_00046433 [Camellia sinensis var. sinensis]
MDLMRRVYEGATATEKYAWTLGAGFEPVATDDGTSPLMKKIARTTVVCPLSSLPRSVKRLSTTLLCQRMTRR